MNTRVAFLSVLAVLPPTFAAANASAAVDEDAPVVSHSAGASPGPWLIRAEGGFMPMRDSWLGILVPEVGLTVGRDLLPRVSVELTGNVREPGGGERQAWSAAAAARWVAVANATRRHALTVAAGPFIEFDNVVHGTMPFARAELAYVYRSSFGLTALAGAGLNMALATSSYREPPPVECPTGDSPSFCLDLGPDAQEIHAGDMLPHMRLALGWQF